MRASTLRVLAAAVASTLLAGSVAVVSRADRAQASPVLRVPPHAKAECIHEPTPFAPESAGATTTETQLVPGNPAAMVICEYIYKHLAPRRIDTLGPTTIRAEARIKELADELNELPAQQPSGHYVCPAITGSNITVALEYAERPMLVVTLMLGGCGDVSRPGAASKSTYGPTGQRLLSQLKKLTAS